MLLCQNHASVFTCRRSILENLVSAITVMWCLYGVGPFVSCPEIQGPGPPAGWKENGGQVGSSLKSHINRTHCDFPFFWSVILDPTDHVFYKMFFIDGFFLKRRSGITGVPFGRTDLSIGGTGKTFHALSHWPWAAVFKGWPKRLILILFWKMFSSDVPFTK